MNKKLASIIVFLGLVTFALPAFAQITVPNFISANSIGALLCQIASGIGTLFASLGTIMILIAGFLYLTSAGNTGRMQTAKSALVWAIIGIVIGLAAPLIVSYVVNLIGGSGSCPS